MIGNTAFLGLSSLLALSSAYPTFQERIPNGNNVPHPCKVNYRWPGVGHENPKGGGTRNVFGLAFQNAGYNWTKALCNQDSDGDGQTNGQELGDPLCTWTAGHLPSRTTNISHPGICDPYNSDSCKSKNTFVSCELKGFETCDTIKKPDVFKLDLKFLKTQVPPTETNHYCMTFDLPSDQDYHVIANEPIMDNINVLHHMLLYGCDNPDDAYIPTPRACGMSAQRKRGSIIGGWSVGQSGNCFQENTGFRIGKTAFKRVRLEIHYNNPGMVQDYTDSSGIRLYYQPAKAGVQDLITFTTGQLSLEIPPGQSEVEKVGLCPSSCTRDLIKKPANVTSAINHMHYMGKRMTVEVFRKGAKVIALTDDKFYSYDSPVSHVYNPPFELLPGDEIKTTCVYNSLSNSRYVYYGEATSDEMCFGFITLYPKDALGHNKCLSFGSLSTCDIRSGSALDKCNWVAFTKFRTNAKIVNDVTQKCKMDGFCRPECREVLKGLESNPCLQGEANKWVTFLLKKSKKGLEFLARLHSCPGTNYTITDGFDGDDDAAPRTSAVTFNVLLLVLTFFLFM